MTSSDLASLIALPESDRQAVLDGLSEAEAEALLYDWSFWARANQLPPEGDWRVWLLLAGRGFGKSRTGAEWVRSQVEAGQCRRLALVAPTAADARDVMVEGESGLLAVCPPWHRPLYEPSKRRLTWPDGSMATLYSAEEPDRLRGPQHDGAWLDELAAWSHPEAYDMLMMGLRLGSDPRIVVTTTPRPTRIIKDLISSSTTVVTHGSTYENVDNLAPAFRDQIIRRYEGTRLGRQELHAELLADVPGALWTRDLIESNRRPEPPRDLVRIVVAVDPSISDSEDSAEAGVLVCGVGGDGRGWVLEDCSLRATPRGWAQAAVSAYHRWRADRVVAEINQGGLMVEHTLRTVDPAVPYTGVHASRGKVARAEPVSALYERGMVHHISGFPDLEDQMCTWVPGEASPDRLDALVWGLTELMLGPTADNPIAGGEPAFVVSAPLDPIVGSFA